MAMLVWLLPALAPSTSVSRLGVSRDVLAAQLACVRPSRFRRPLVVFERRRPLRGVGPCLAHLRRFLIRMRALAVCGPLGCALRCHARVVALVGSRVWPRSAGPLLGVDCGSSAKGLSKNPLARRGFGGLRRRLWWLCCEVGLLPGIVRAAPALLLRFALCTTMVLRPRACWDRGHCLICLRFSRFSLQVT